MRPFAAIERFFERLLERPSARLFGARLEPATVLLRIERAMEGGRQSTRDGTVVPDRYSVRMHPDEVPAGEAASTLASELADGALRFAKAHGYRLLARPRVDLVPDPRVPVGDISVEARFDRPRSGASRSATSASAAGSPDTASPQAPADDTARPGAGPGTGAGHPAGVIAASDGLPGEATMVYRPPQVGGRIARLRVLEPTGADRALAIDGGMLTIGRDPDNDVVLGDPRASRHHARLMARQGTLVLVDLGSSNGTLVNGAVVAEIAIGVGDEIRIGDTRMLIEPLTA
jgi:hypothetical protein